jgi:DUF971 family protein
MLFIEKIINAGNCELVIKWNDGKQQILKAYFLQANCPCISCQIGDACTKEDVKINKVVVKARLGLQIVFSSGCQKGIYSFNQIRSWLKDL